MKIGVIGLGYVGLTFSVVAASRGFTIEALETNADIKKLLHNGRAHFFEPGLDDLIHGLLNKKLFIKESFERQSKLDVFFVTVGTPLKPKAPEPNYDYLLSALKALENSYDGSQLVILRSTVAVGTSRKMVLPYLAKIGNIEESDVQLAFCPERTIEGKAVVELQELPQIIGFNNITALKKAESLFREITHTIIKVDSLEAAELIKLFNNTYRDIHFAIGNIFNEISQGYGIDGVKLIKTANRGYDRSNIALPGFVGGPCLEKDSYILAENMADTPGRRFVLNSRHYNESLETNVVNWISKNCSTDDRICLSGLPFKGQPPTSDLRGSSSISVAKKLIELGYKPRLHDFEAYEREVEDLLGAPMYKDLYSASDNCSVLVILNNNTKYQNVEISSLIKKMCSVEPLILDYWSMLNQASVNLHKSVNYFTAGTLMLRER